MKKITIELDDNFADAISITTIGHGGGYARNVNTTAFDLTKGGSHWALMCQSGDVTKPVWVRIE